MLRETSRPSMLRDRREAGERLAVRLERYKDDRPAVLALPRGGVVVGYAIARRLKVPLDVLIVRKIGAPDNPEYGLGAIAEDGTHVIDEPRVREAGYRLEDLEPTIQQELAEIRRRAEAYRAGLPGVDVSGRTVILVDDGVATGVTLRVAIRSVRSRGPKRVVVALGVAPQEAFHQLGRLADEVIALAVPEVFFAVGEWYQHFDQVTDQEVQRLLIESRAPAPSTSA
jgi:predicted phosphoribosyltransferase